MSATKSAIARRSRLAVGREVARLAPRPIRPRAVASVARTKTEVAGRRNRAAPRAREADRQRHARRGHRDAGVAEQDPAHPLPARERPPERDRPAPVVRGQHDRPLDLERGEDAPEVVDPLRESAARRSERPIETWSIAITR